MEEEINLRAERNLIQIQTVLNLIQAVLNQNAALQTLKIQGHHHFKNLLGNLDFRSSGKDGLRGSSGMPGGVGRALPTS